jgi:hypothetical protein
MSVYRDLKGELDLLAVHVTRVRDEVKSPRFRFQRDHEPGVQK